jgi:hypothetical protein
MQALVLDVEAEECLLLGADVGIVASVINRGYPARKTLTPLSICFRLESSVRVEQRAFENTDIRLSECIRLNDCTQTAD